MDSNEGGSNGESSDTSPQRVEATKRSIEILASLKDDGPANLTEIATRLGYSKSTVHRHLATLVEEGYITNDDGRYQIGLLYLDYGIHARSESELYQFAKPKVDDLADDLGEKVWIMAEDNGYGVFLYHASGKHPVKTYTRDGYRAYLHAFAAGKAILAFMDRDRVDHILHRRGMPTETSKTVTDRAELYAELDRIRDRGVAFNREESITGIHAVAAPILSPKDEPLGSITVAGPASRIDGEYLEQELPQLLLGVANEIEVNLAYN